MAGFTKVDVVLGGTTQSVAASQTKQAITNYFKLEADDSLHFRADVMVSAVTGSVDVILQTTNTPKDSSSWEDAKSIAVTGTGRNRVKLLVEDAADQTYLPLMTYARLVATTGGGEALTVTAVEFTSRR